jgi:peptidoglycan/xylan/chitin deacetylase (PgdA/CDA1 family)
VILSHDLDSPEGLRNLVGSFLALEEAAGARSVSFVVPCGWPLDQALLDEIRARGHEIGVHGYDHSNRTPFLGHEQRLQRLGAARSLIDRYDVVGYRAPSLVRTRQLLADLQRFYRYDSSIPTSGGPFPVPNNGCASARPFRMFDIWEIPLSMPRDGTLRFLGYSHAEILETWKSCADLIARSGGVVTLLTHCEHGFSGNPGMLANYRRFLEHLVVDGRFAFVTASRLLERLPSSSL